VKACVAEIVSVTSCEGFLMRHVLDVYSEQKSAPGFTKKSSGTPAKSSGGKKASRKDDEWEEVARKFVISLHFLFLCAKTFMISIVMSLRPAAWLQKFPKVL